MRNSINQSRPIYITSEDGATTIDPVTSAPDGTPGLPVYSSSGAAVQPTEDSADGTIGGDTQPEVGIQLGFWNGSEYVAVSSANPLPTSGGGGGGGNVTITSPIGQTTMSASVAVTIASDQSDVPITGTVEAEQSGTWNITAVTSITDAVTVIQPTAADLNATVIGTGTFAVQAAQEGTWTVDIAAGQTIAVTNVGVFAVQDSIAEEYLATLAGAVSASKMNVEVQNSTLIIVGDGTAGTPAGGVVSIQGVSGGQAVPVSLASAPETEVTQGTSPWVVQDSTSEGYLATLAGAVSSSEVQVNVTNSSIAVTGTFYQATQPVSGTVTAEIEGHAGATLDGAAGSPSTQCVTIQGNASGTAVPVSGTFYPATQPVSGTVTAEIEGHAGATLDGAAGSPSTQCVTVQGNASGTAIPTTDSGLNVAQGSTTSGETGPLNQMATVTSAPTDTNAKTNPMRGDAAGNLRINPFGQTGSFANTLKGSATGAAGLTLTVPTGYKFIFKCCLIEIVIANSGSARGMNINFQDAVGNYLAGNGAGFSQATNSTVFYTAGPGLPLSASQPTSTDATIPLPEIYLPPGGKILFAIANGVAGDTIDVLGVNGILIPD